MKKVAWCGLLVALALSLSVAESWFPLALIVPVPGIKLGLANVVIAVALYTMSVRETAAIMVGKVVLTAVFSASVTGFLFSLLGGVCSVFTLSRWDLSPALPRIWCWKKSQKSLNKFIITENTKHKIKEVMINEEKYCALSYACDHSIRYGRLRQE